MRHNIIKKIAAIVSIGWAVVAVFSVVRHAVLQAKAEDTLFGIQTLVREVQERENPYTILEIVPDAVSAEIGYYAEGNEPILSERQSDGTYLTWQERLAKIETKRERYDFMTTLAEDLQDFYDIRFPGQVITSEDLKHADQVPVSYTPYSELDEKKDGCAEFTLSEREKYGVFRYSNDTTKVRYKLDFKYEGHCLDTTLIGNPKKQFYYAEATLVTSSNVGDLLPNTVLYTLKDGDNPTKQRFERAGLWKDLQDTVSGGGAVSGTVSGNVNGGGNIAGEMPLTAFGTVSGNATGGDNTVTGGDNIGADGDGTVSGSDLDVDYYIVKFAPWDISMKEPFFKGLYSVSRVVEDIEGEYVFSEEEGADFPVIFPEETIYYTGGFVNNDWFARKVINLDPDQVEGFPVKVITMTAYEVAKLDGFGGNDSNKVFDLLYLASGWQMLPGDIKRMQYNEQCTEGDRTYVNDLNPVMRDYLFNYTVSNGIPCIVDAGIVFDPAGSRNPVTGKYELNLQHFDGINYTNIFQLALMFMQESPSKLYEQSMTPDYNAPTVDELVANLTDMDNNYVAEQVYTFYQPHTLIGPDFFTEYYYKEAQEQGDIAKGFKPVIDEIIAENLNRAADTSGNYEQLPEDVTQATIVRHIINYKNRRTTLLKKHLRVLDIEPCMSDENSYELNEAMVREWALGADASNDEIELDIIIDHMTTAEFIGKIDDINERYDLVYIGTDTDHMNVDENGDTVFNDADMNGLVYFHTGDLRITSVDLAGQLDTEHKGDKVYTYNQMRYSGNDITQEKRNELTSFLNASYPIVVSERFFTMGDSTAAGGNIGRVLNENIVDKSSYMYEFLDIAKDKGNFFTRDEVAKDGMFGFYLNRPKIEFSNVLICNGKFADGYNSIYQIEQGLDGKYLLEYRFTIVNAGAASTETRYRCQLYADADADGRYSAVEELGDISVTQNGKEVDPNELLVGREYVVKRAVPNEYAGLLPWKIQITQADNPNIHNGIIGYTKLKGLERERVNILQITRDPFYEKEELFNLQERVDDPKDMYHKLIYGSFDQADGGKYTGIYDDFDISVKTMTLTEFIKQHHDEPDILNKYNMLILGFADGYGDIANDDNALEDIRKYVTSGKSVLFTHDTISFVNYEKGTEGLDRSTGYTQPLTKTNKYNSYGMTKTFRAMVGMERYSRNKDTAYWPKSEKVNSGLTQGYTYSIINAKDAYKNNGNQETYPAELTGLKTDVTHNYLNLNYGDVYYSDTSSDNGDIIQKEFGEVSNLEVTQVNKGQITEYPYKLEETLEVSPTHAQYYQLDYFTDEDRDNKSDIVVWYCLGGRSSKDEEKQNTIYSMSPNDVMNNYYIYNKGNITYTSMGHSGDSSTEHEAKLFINTMIAAFRAGVKTPTVAVLNNGTRNAVEITSVNRYHDDTTFDSTEGYTKGKDLQEVDGYIDADTGKEYEKVYFRVNDSNFIKGTRRITVNVYQDVYVEDPGNVPSDVMTHLTYEGEQIYVKPILEPGASTALSIHEAATNKIIPSDSLNSGEIYYILIPKQYITNAEKRYSIYFETWSTIKNYTQTIETDRSMKRFDFTKVQLFDLK